MAESKRASQELMRQAIAANWSLSQVDAQDWNNLCQQFVENAFGTTGRYPTAAAAAKALFKSRNLSQAKPGALVFFKADSSNQDAGHAGVYLGGDRMISATPSGVKVTHVTSDPYYSKLFVGWGEAPPDWKGRNVGKDILDGATQLVDKLMRATASPVEAASEEGTPMTQTIPLTHEYRGPLPETPTPAPAAPPSTLERARKNLEDIESAIAALQGATPGTPEAFAAPTELPRLITARTTALSQLAAEENRIRDDERAANAPPRVETRGDKYVQWNPQTKKWDEVGDVPGKEDKPDDPSLIGQRNASAAVSLKQLEKLEFDLEVARKKEERIGLAAQAIDAANSLPDGPDKTRALREATRGVLAISDPEAFDRSVREEAQAELNRQREEREVQEFQALQTQREVENTRAAEAAATREREGIATGTRALLDSETRRATSAVSARQQHFQSGIGSLKNMPEFQKLSAPLTPEMAAQAVGMDPSSAKFRTIWGNAQSFMNGQPQQPTPPQQTAAPIVTQSNTAPVAAIARGAMGPQAADLSEIGGSGWGQQYDPSTGQAQGDPYDIPEEGEQAAPTGPAPAPSAIQKLIRSLGTATPSLAT